MENIVLNIPHSSINGIFHPEYGKWQHNQYFVNDCVGKWTDWYTDFLFSALASLPDVYPVIFPYSRFVCDAERLEDDALNEEGQGIIYTNFKGHKRGDLNAKSVVFLKGLWQRHQAKLAEHLVDDSILIDCHSFPSDLHGADICIGHNDDWSYKPEIVDGIVGIFEENGYTVSVNKPYSNSITPKCDASYKSVMIEVNKKVYMIEKTRMLMYDTGEWTRWGGTLNKLYTFLKSCR